MTISENPGSSAPSRATLLEPDVDGYSEDVRCPLCGRRVDDSLGTPSVPVEKLEAAEPSIYAETDSVPVYGYRCDRHRGPVVLPAPATIAPENYHRVSVTLEEGSLETAAPRPALAADGGGSL